MLAHHNDLSLEQWQRLSFEYQLGNIGSEITRARAWEEKGDHEQRNRALERALELIDLTLQCTQAGELKILRAVAHDKLAMKNTYDCPLDALENYFLPFALLARKK